MRGVVLVALLGVVAAVLAQPLACPGCCFYETSTSGATSWTNVLYNAGWTRADEPCACKMANVVRYAHDSRFVQACEDCGGCGRTLFVNRIANSRVITRKDTLVAALEAMEGESGSACRAWPPLADMHPHTLVLSHPSDYWRIAPFLALEPIKTTYVAKFADASQGDGVEIYGSATSKRLRTRFGYDEKSGSYVAPRGAERAAVLQRHLDSQLLLDGRKCELRAYWAVLSEHPLIVAYHDGTVRRTARDYVHGEWRDAARHITNTRQQKIAAPTEYAEQSDDDLKWSFERLERHLIDLGRITTKSEGAWIATSLRPALKTLVVRGASALDLSPHNDDDIPRRGELFGLDVLLEDTKDRVGGDTKGLRLEGSIRLWLTEYQVGPGQSVDSNVKRALIPRMTHSLLAMWFEVTRRINEHEPLDDDSTLPLGDWQIVINEARSFVFDDVRVRAQTSAQSVEL